MQGPHRRRGVVWGGVYGGQTAVQTLRFCPYHAISGWANSKAQKERFHTFGAREPRLSRPAACVGNQLSDRRALAAPLQCRTLCRHLHRKLRFSLPMMTSKQPFRKPKPTRARSKPRQVTAFRRHVGAGRARCIRDGFELLSELTDVTVDDPSTLFRSRRAPVPVALSGREVSFGRSPISTASLD